MGRPPGGGGPAFRFTQAEVLEMEARLQEVNNAVPPREIINGLADKFSASAERAGRSIVQPKQVWNWFQNRRYAQRAKLGKAPGKLSVSSMPSDESHQFRNVAAPIAAPPGRNLLDVAHVEFEAKSARDGAWYDVSVLIAHRITEAGDPEVRVRFSGFGVEEDEWIDVRKCVRQRSLPCEAAECIAVLPGDLILCFQEGKEQALYFDAHILDAQRRRHDVRGCRCRFLVRYDHDQSEEIVPLRKVCRRPETDYRLQVFHGSKIPGTMEPHMPKDPTQLSASKDLATSRTRKHRKLMDVNTDEITALPHPNENINLQSLNQALPVENSKSTVSDLAAVDAVVITESTDNPQ